MADASNYPVTFAYGATTPPYGTAALPYHRGDDRAMPVGTRVIVNGTQIGLSGNTGLSTGAHLHIGRFVGGKDTNPNGSGFSLTPPVMVTTVSGDGTNGNFVRLTDGNGVQWVYLHLSKQTVTQGQTLSTGATMDDKDITAMYLAAGKSVADATLPANLAYYRGKKPEQLANDLYKGNNQGNPSYFYKASHYDEDVKAAQGTVLKPGNYKVI